MTDCIFCKIIRKESPADIICEWNDAIAFVPLNPVSMMHTLVVPKTHVENFMEDPDVTASVMKRAAFLGKIFFDEGNLITSAGKSATQTVFHLHVHVVDRWADDGLKLPWSEG